MLITQSVLRVRHGLSRGVGGTGGAEGKGWRPHFSLENGCIINVPFGSF